MSGVEGDMADGVAMKMWWGVLWAMALGCITGCATTPSDEDDDVDAGGDGDADADGDGGATCRDDDGDGAGVGDACESDDCDDTDPGTTSECGTDCDDHPGRLGCPCDAEGGVLPCYRGPAGTAGQGRCTAGIQRCEGGVFGACIDQILPRAEFCDEFDDDCDGVVDNGVLNECGSCGACEQECSGVGDGCQEWGDAQIAGLLVTPEGWLTLGGRMTTLHVIWPSSSGTGSIFRVNTRTYEIEGAYWTGPLHGGGDSPSRTAVDDFGNVVVANRAFGMQASITQIAANEDDCVDHDHNGRIDTSHGWDDLLAFDDHDDWEDECILWHTPVGDRPDANARAVAIHSVTDLDGLPHDFGWVGMYGENRFLEFDVETGEFTGEEARTDQCSPYGGAIDREGLLWATCLSSIVGHFDTADPDESWEAISLPGGGQGLRVIVDENDTPWISGDDLYRYNRDDEDWTRAGLVGGGFGFVGGVASDGQGSLWVGTYTDGQFVYRVSNDPDEDELEHHQVPTPGTFTFGTGVDFEGNAWTFGFNDGTASVIDIDTEESTVVLNDCGNRACLSTPYVRGDVTGLQRRNALNPRGTWSSVVEGCADPARTTWARVVVDADTPAGSNISVAVRTSDALDQLAAQPWTNLGVVPDDGVALPIEPAFDGAGIDHGHYLSIQVLLQSLDRGSSPTLRSLSTQFGCSALVD